MRCRYFVNDGRPPSMVAHHSIDLPLIRINREFRRECLAALSAIPKSGQHAEGL